MLECIARKENIINIIVKFKYFSKEYLFRSLYLDFIFLDRKVPISIYPKLNFILKKYLLIFKNLFFRNFELGKSKVNIFNSDFYYNHKLGTIGGLQASFAEHMNWFKQLNLDSNPVLVDIGANVGNVSFAFKYFWKNSKVIAIEPDQLNFKTLQLNFKDTKFENVHLLNIACGELENSTIFLLKNQKEGALVKTFKKFNDLPNGIDSKLVTEVSCNTLDNIVGQFELKKIDILKIDTEGFEISVLKSGIETLKKVKYLHIELNLDEYLFSEVIDTLFAAGLKFQLLKSRIFGYNNNNYIAQGDFLFELRH